MGSVVVRRWATATLLAVAGALVSWWRLDATTRQTVWAEDGMFLQDRMRDGVAGSLFDSYAGYLHVAPRLLVDTAYGVAPLDDFALALTLLCCVTVGVVAALVFACSHAVVPSVGGRVVLGAVTVLAPVAPVEVLGNAANLHWYLLWLVPWLVLASPPRRWQQAVLVVAMLLATLSEIQALMFLPLALLAIRDRNRRPVAVALVVGAAVQLAVTLQSPRPGSDLEPGLLDVVGGYLLNVVLPLWHPSLTGAGPAFADHGWSLAVLAALPFLVVGLLHCGVLVARAVRARSLDLDQAALALALLVGATAPFVLGLVLNFQANYAYSRIDVLDLSDNRPLRYGVVPGMFLLAMVVVAAGTLWRARASGRVLGAVLVAGVLALGLVHVGDTDGTRRAAGPTWESGLVAAARSCREPGAPPTVAVTIAPKAFQVVLDCAQLEA